ncbi:inorganic triphosphatase [Ferrimonas balearica]|uniref:CYTH domain-containing protein n=1 Tax=Ferrimonas balearica TaxID=44012 RepID=UPI001F173B8C|nr:CYTH domain-containing protein [Ferrimonas balearica]MBY6095923.1 CYTH domain-containing protein [Ferrimonas balearica]
MEVELKLLLAPETPVGALSSLEFPATLTQIKRASLGNAYFDTPDLALRQRDMGLRIRRRGDFREQTLKTAGRVEGGLHARPEYNTEVSGECPQLERFPDTLWSKKEREAIQAGLAVQFHTDFERQQGELSLADGVRVELALDSGTIRAGERSEVIAELELELISGEASALLPLARQLMSQWPLRLGLDSKAARGYRLAGLASWPEVVENAATQPLALLAAWQRNEERLLAGELAAAAPLAAQLQAVVTLLGESAEGLLPLAQALQGDAPQLALRAALGATEYGLTQLSLLALSLD